MLEFYLNTTSPQWFGLDGNPFRDNNPSMAFLSRDTVKIIACTETPEAGEENVDPTSWPRDVSWAAIPGIGAKITVDNDYIHKLKGTLATEVSAGSTASISATIENASYATVPASGTVRLFDASGNYEAIAYTARNISGNTVVFTTSGTLTGSYESGATMDCDQSPYCEAYLDTAQSNLEQGEFVFQLVVDSSRLREEMDYTNTARLDVQGLEMLVYKTVDGNDEPVKAYLCDTFSITGTIGNVGYEAEPPDPVKNQIAGIVNQLAAAGFEVEQQYDESGNTQFRFRSSSAGGTWSQWITVSKGEKGETGETGAAAGFGTPSVTVETLPAGSDATASVTASGDNTAKVFSFNFGIPKGADGKNGTDGKAGADGVSSYTYVAYASDASGAGFSLTPSNALKYRAEIHTTTAIETPDAEDFAGATWVKYLGDDGTGAGDMLKSVYDTDDDGIVDHAAAADAVGATTAAQVADAVGKAHTHANKTTLDKLAEADGKLTYDGAEIGGGSGTVKSVNGQLPDESGNVTIETGGAVDESRLLPVLNTLPEGYEGSLLAVQRGDGKVADENTLRLMHFNDDVRDVVTDETGTLKGNASITPTGYFAGALSINHAVVSSLSFNGLTATPTAWTMDFRVKLGRFSDNAPLVLIGTNLNETQTSLIRVSSSYVDIQATYTQRVIYKTHSLQLDTWYHFALTYDGTTYKFYIDGTLFGTGESTNQFDFTRKLWFGSFYDYSTSYVSDCTIDEFRLSNVVRWTENFTPPDKPYGESLYNWGIGPKLDESRLLPELATIPEELSGHPVVYDYQSGIDADTLCLLHLDDSTWADATGKNTITQHGSKGKVADNGYFDKALDLTANSSGVPDWLTVPWLAEYEAATWTMEFFAKPTKSVVNFMFFSFGNSQKSYLSLGSQSLTNLWLGNGSGTYTGNFSFSLNTWYWFVIQYDGSAVKVYVDGQLVVQGNFTPNYVGQDLQFGNLNLVENSDNTFIGYLDEFRWSKGLRYPTGVMEIPTQPFGTPSKGYKVSEKALVTADSPRLLPENPANGDIPCYSNEPPVGVNYNDANTVLLLQGSSDNTAAAPTAERLNGIVTGEFPVQADGSILVNGTSNYITFNDADARRVFSGEFTLETYIKTTQFTASGKRQDTNWCVVYRNGGSVTDYQWLLLSDFYADAGKFGIWPYPQMSGETFPKTLVNAEFQHVAIDVYMVDGVRKFTMYRNGVPYHTGNYWSTTPADWSSGVSAAMRLFGEGPSGGDDYLSNASVMSLRVSNVARYKGVSFDPPADGKYLTPPAGYWGKLNKSELVQSVNGVAPDENGNVNIDSALTLDQLEYNDVPYKYQGMTIDSSSEDSNMTSRFYGKAVSTFGDLDSTATFPSFPFKPYLRDDSIVGGEEADIYYELWKSDSDNTDEWNTIEFKSVNAPSKIVKISAQTAGTDACVMSYILDGLDSDGVFRTRITEGQMTLAASSASNVLGDFSELNFNTNEVAEQYFESFELKVRTEGASGDTGASGIASIKFMITEKNAAWVGINKKNLVQSINGYKPLDGTVTLPEATTSAAGLMAAADKAAIAGLTAQGIYPNAAVAAAGSGIDYNLFKTQGTFYIPYHTAVSNGPVSAGSNGVYPGGFLSILQANLSGGTSVQQIFHQHASNNAYIRSYNGDLDIWTDWQRTVTDADITESKTRPGYFKLPGGMIVQWGAVLNITADGTTSVTLPIAFPNSAFIATATATGSGLIASAAFDGNSKLNVIVKGYPGSGNFTIYWIAIGY